MTRQVLDLVRQTYRAEVAYRHVAAISQYHRIQASPGYRAAAGYVASRLREAGLEVTVHEYPADGVARYWSAPSFLEWDCTSATLELLGVDGQPEQTLCDFAAIPTSVIQRSIPVDGDFEVVMLPDKGTGASDYAGIDVRGKLVLTDEAPDKLLRPVVRERGAAGFLFYGMAAGGRSELDLPDARQYTSFWWPGSIQPDAWGFVLSPRQGRALTARLSEGKSSVRVRAHIASRHYAGAIEVVDALLPGTADATHGMGAGQEVLLTSHLCHPQPGAHDNASGSAALIEAAAALARLVAGGALPRPRRGIRFLWIPEMTGTYAWLADHEAQVKAGRWIAGLNLDMVGADQNASGSVWTLTDLPQAAPAFADHLLAWLRRPLVDGQRHTEAPFEPGSDHYILSDPTVGIPTPMLIQWPDRYYHTSADTLDKVCPDSLERSGSLAAAYAYWLATAWSAEARWLGHHMVARHRDRTAALAGEAAEAWRAADDAAARAEVVGRYRRQNAFVAERMSVALGTLSRLAPDLADDIAALRRQAQDASTTEEAWLAAQAGSDPAADEPEEATPAWRSEAERWVPERQGMGPVDETMALRLASPEIQEAWERLVPASHQPLRELGPTLQYWADGRRTIAGIADAAALETGEEHLGEVALAYFRLMAEMGTIRLRATETEPGAS